MFYAPTTVASMVAALSPEAHEGFKECYSDFHKDAIGCRPRKPAPECPVAAAVEEARLSEWMTKDAEMEQMGYELARYRFSRSLEYLQRRGEAEGLKEAMMMHIMRVMDCASIAEFLEGLDWDYVCYQLGLPYSDAAKLREVWETPT